MCVTPVTPARGALQNPDTTSMSEVTPTHGALQHPFALADVAVDEQLKRTRDSERM